VTEPRAGPPLSVGVTGASGFLGRALCGFLAARGHSVFRFVRGQAAAPDELSWLPGRGVLNPRELDGLDAVVHLSGASLADGRWTAARKRELVDSRAGSTATLAGAIAACGRPPRVLVSASAVGWYGDRGDEPLDESSGAGRGFLAELAQAWEAAAEPARAAGVRVVHPRTGLVLARGRGVLGALERPFALGLGGPLGNGRAWWSWIALEDWLAALAFALGDERVRGPYNAVAPEPVPQGVFARALGRALHRPALLPAPALALRALMGRELADDMLLASQRARPAVLLAAGFRFAEPALGDLLDRLYTNPTPA
jgi:uncharacterized protein (TIGR01777 family)